MLATIKTAGRRTGGHPSHQEAATYNVRSIDVTKRFHAGLTNRKAARTAPIEEGVGHGLGTGVSNSSVRNSHSYARCGPVLVSVGRGWVEPRPRQATANAWLVRQLAYTRSSPGRGAGITEVRSRCRSNTVSRLLRSA